MSLKKLKEELLYNRLDYKELYNLSPCGYFIATPKGVIIEANQRFIDFTGYEETEVMGEKRLIDFLSLGNKMYYETHFLPQLYYKGEVSEINFEIVKKNNDKIPVLVNAVIVNDKDGEAKFMQATVFNISQRKSYEKELLLAKQKADDLSKELLSKNKALKSHTALILSQKKELEILNRHLETKNKQLSDFAHIVSHNLRSPVFNLQTLLDFYNESVNAEDKQEVVTNIREVANEMHITLNELVDALKIQEEFRKTEDVLSFEAILKTIIVMVSGTVKATQAKITSNFSNAPQITYSSVYLKSAMLNLLTNALKYRALERTPEVHFSTVIKDGCIVLSVRDNGMGIDMKKHRNALFGFNKTFHEHPDSKGLGLYMTRLQIEALGGKISAESEVGLGSTFSIRFKAAL